MTSEQVISLDALVALVRERGGEGRSITAVAGGPASGKSTLAEMLAARLNALDPGSAAVLPMDGFHLDDMVLEERGWRARKGAPHTFDAAGLAHMLRRLRANEDAEVAAPLFDRSIEIARAGARMIPRSVRRVIVEGNYLLLDEAPWRDLRALFDTTVFAHAPEDELRRRLAERWRDLPPAEREAKIEENDLPNARLVAERGASAEFVVAAAGLGG